MIYFDKKKNAYGFEIDGYICVIDDTLWEKYAGTDKWDIIDGVFTDITNTQEYINKKEQEEIKRISHLKCTKRILALILQEYGIPYSRLKEEIERNNQAQLEWDLCVELERCNPLLNVIGEKLGISSEQIDNIFKYANGEIKTLGVG